MPSWSAVPPDPPDLLAHLREATAESHRHLEGLTRLDRSPIDRDDLARFLFAMRAYLATVEPALEGFPEAWVPFEPRLVERLDHDLAELGAAPEPPEIEPATPGTAEEAWGVAYVIEGSRLGGKMLARTLRGSAPDLSNRYLYQGRDAPRWLDFRHRLRESGPDPDVTIAAARGAFRDIAEQVASQHRGRRQTP